MKQACTLEGKIAVITGCGRGIGRAIALGYARAGASLTGVDIDEEAAQKTMAECRAVGAGAVCVKTDVTDSRDVEDMVRAAMDRYGRIDVLVNNAGGPVSPSAVVTMSEELWDEVINLNLRSTFLCNRAAGRQMLKQRSGVIINVASAMGMTAYPFSAHYAASKAAIINFTQTLAVELGQHNVRVNAIAPGPVMTEKTEEIYRQNPEMKNERISYTPLGRVAVPDDISGAAVFLASDMARFITGEVIKVDGGLVAVVTPRIMKRLNEELPGQV